MAYRNGNYCAFYVKEPFSQYGLGANQAPDFRYYNMLRMWKGADSTFSFVDSHDKNYNVRDGSDWEYTLKPRLRERLRCSKNIVLFLSSITQNSVALREEIDYGINNQGLPLIVVYPEFDSYEGMLYTLNGAEYFTGRVTSLWDRVPILRESMKNVASVHVPLNQRKIRTALSEPGYTVQRMKTPGLYVL